MAAVPAFEGAILQGYQGAPPSGVAAAPWGLDRGGRGAPLRPRLMMPPGHIPPPPPPVSAPNPEEIDLDNEMCGDGSGNPNPEEIDLDDLGGDGDGGHGTDDLGRIGDCCAGGDEGEPQAAPEGTDARRARLQALRAAAEAVSADGGGAAAVALPAPALEGDEAPGDTILLQPRAAKLPRFE